MDVHYNLCLVGSKKDAVVMVKQVDNIMAPVTDLSKPLEEIYNDDCIKDTSHRHPLLVLLISHQGMARILLLPLRNLSHGSLDALVSGLILLWEVHEKYRHGELSSGRTRDEKDPVYEMLYDEPLAFIVYYVKGLLSSSQKRVPITIEALQYS